MLWIALQRQICAKNRMSRVIPHVSTFTFCHAQFGKVKCCCLTRMRVSKSSNYFSFAWKYPAYLSTLVHALEGFVSTPVGEGGVLPEKLGGGVQPAYQNPYPISDQNLWFSLPYFKPHQKFNTLFQTFPVSFSSKSRGAWHVTGACDKPLRHVHSWNIIWEALLLMVLSIMIKK